MFVPINDTTQNTRDYNSQNTSKRANNDTTPRHASGSRSDAPEEISKSGTGIPSRTTVEKTDKNLSSLHDVAVQYSIHDETGKTMIKVIDKESDRVIREIPSEKELERSMRMRKYVGQLFDAVV